MTVAGILYTVWPLDKQARTWLRSQNIALSDRAARWPTRSELRDELASLRGVDVEYIENGPGERWDASLTENVNASGVEQ